MSVTTRAAEAIADARTLAGEYADEVLAAATEALGRLDPLDDDPIGALYDDPDVTGAADGGLAGLGEAEARACVLACPWPAARAYRSLHGAWPDADAGADGWRAVDSRLRCLALGLLEPALEGAVAGRRP